MADPLEALFTVLREYPGLVTAYSGGADSALLAWAAHEVHGPRALAITAVSASLPARERAGARDFARRYGLRQVEVCTDELDRAEYRANGADRCAHCKSALMAALVPIAEAAGVPVALGTNLDDLGDHRPGQRAAAERGARFPLVDAGFTKDDVRETSRQLGLRTWDKPAAACLASRVPYGTAVTLGVLESVAVAEAALHRLGFRQLRVRHYGDLARVELEAADMPAALDQREDIVRVVQEAGYRYVTLDLEGFRSGNLNGALQGRSS